MALQRQLWVLDGKLALTTPEPKPAVKLAFATSDLKFVNQHFGSAERFAIYQVEAERVTLLEVAEFGDLKQDGNENKLLEKFVLLDGCAAVYCQAVGASAIRQLISLGVQPLRVNERAPIGKLIEETQAALRDGPTGWLARAVSRHVEKSPERFDEMAAENWDE